MLDDRLQLSPLRIALFTHSVNPRGGVVHTLELARALHEAGHQVSVLLPAEPGQRLFREMPCEVVLMPVPPALRDVATMVAERIAACAAFLRATFRADDFDIWHAQDSITGNVLATLQGEGRIPGFTRTVHHLDPFTDPRLAHWQQRGFSAAEQVFCVSELWQHTLLKEHGVRAARITNGVDLQRYSPRAGAPASADVATALALGLRPGAPLFVSVGGIEARKNTLRSLEAFIEVQRELPGAQWVVAGGASLLDHGAYGRQFQALLRSSGLPHQAVKLTGPLPDAAMPALLRLADALLMPSLREGFGLVVLEALASGTPVVVSNIAPFTAYLRSDDPVAWADPQHATSIARAMREVLTLPPFSQPPAVCAQHSWASSAARHVELYRGLAACSGRLRSPATPDAELACALCDATP